MKQQATERELEATKAAVDERGEDQVLGEVEEKQAAPKCARCGAVMVDWVTKWVCPKNAGHAVVGK